MQHQRQPPPQEQQQYEDNRSAASSTSPALKSVSSACASLIESIPSYSSRLLHMLVTSLMNLYGIWYRSHVAIKIISLMIVLMNMVIPVLFINTQIGRVVLIYAILTIGKMAALSRFTGKCIQLQHLYIYIATYHIIIYCIDGI